MTVDLRKGLLIIDRGSREKDVRDELDEIAQIAKEKGGYYYSNYCFLEVVPPFIEEGILNCIREKVDSITVVPYFLYPGLKLKESVKQTANLANKLNLNLVITKPLSYSQFLPEIIMERIEKMKRDKNILYKNSECDILIIGHGSSDRRAKDAFIYTVNEVKKNFRNVGHCFLELDLPNIENGLLNLIKSSPKIILIMPYFLHRGIHIKSDVTKEISNALKKYEFSNIHISKHI
ncbi:MAG: CbiX/SirB N-terminal domain-containing protein, partial [Nitrososphaeraceae archaeon]|nr:CbiX/SirB N-terminal domain-containing protein [Nitrososphaeraceae archaeon]